MKSLAVFRLELARSGRRDRSHWLRALYISLLATAVALAWVARNPAGMDWTEQEAMGRYLFRIFSWAQFALLNLAAPLTLAGAISEEKSRKTLPVLLSTGLSSLSISIGKLLGGLLPVMLLLLAGMPILFLLLSFGGLSLLELGTVSAFTLACACLGGACALLGSTFVRKTHIAFGWGLALPPFFFLLAELLTQHPERLEPLHAFFAVMQMAVVTPEEASPLFFSLATTASAIAACVAISACVLRRLTEHERKGFISSSLPWLGRRILFLPEPSTVPCFPQAGDNPVLIRETGSPWQAVRDGVRLATRLGLLALAAGKFVRWQLPDGS